MAIGIGEIEQARRYLEKAAAFANFSLIVGIF